MIRQLADCPYCHHCELALDDSPELVFNPDEPSHAPCPHLAWVDGRYSQWEHTERGINRVIGSIEFGWAHPAAGSEEQQQALLPYLKELARAGANWAFAPPGPLTILTLWSEEKGTDTRGKTFTLSDVDGSAIFAADPATFWSALPACQERQLLGLKVDES